MSFDHAVKVRRLANAPMSEAEWQVRCDLAACYRGLRQERAAIRRRQHALGRS